MDTCVHKHTVCTNTVHTDVEKSVLFAQIQAANGHFREECNAHYIKNDNLITM